MNRKKSKCLPCITSAGMRRDATRRDINMAIPSEDSLIDEIEFRRDHIQ